jgi:hypothetical protein
MNPKLPIQAQCTERILKSVLPEHFKIVSDNSSNGYKYINLLYGAEFDLANQMIKESYNNSFITSIDLTTDYALYELTFSGVPITSYLNSSGSVPIKITNETEFYTGSPTRLVSVGTLPLPMYYLTYTGGLVASGAGFQNSFDQGFNTPCWSVVSGIMGLEYIRKDMRGSGYLVVSSDIDQEKGFFSGMYPLFVIDVGSNLKTSGDYVNTYGMFTGIKDRNYSGDLTYETLYPIDGKTLSGNYPLTREVIDDSGIICNIDHYTPYHGWMRNDVGTVVAVVDYSGEYYYDESGNKIYYRTAYNNPYGYNNYSVAYLDLLYPPISGTLKVFDIDILDVSGNATEIPSNGKTLYYYKSPKMFLGNPSGDLEAKFDPIYLGYSSIVPSGQGFSSNMEGSGCSIYKTTSWNYLHVGGGIDSGTLAYVDGTGLITNKLMLSGYHSRYMVEYKYKIYNNLKYVSSLLSNGTVSLDTQGPLFVSNTDKYNPVPYEFTKDPYYGNESTRIITFDGLKVRPGSRIGKINFNIPMKYIEGDLNGPIFQNTNKLYAGYSNEFVPQISNFRHYVCNCLFDAKVSGNLIERDLTGYGNDLRYSGVNSIYRINYNDKYGKKIIKNTGESYYYKDNNSYLLENTYFQFDCKIRNSQSCRLLELYNDALDKYICFDLDPDGRLRIESDGYMFYSNEFISFNTKNKSIILRYSPDEFSSIIPTFKIYYKESGDPWYRIIDTTPSSYTAQTVDSTTLKIFKNCSIDIGSFKIFYEAQ